MESKAKCDKFNPTGGIDTISSCNGYYYGLSLKNINHKLRHIKYKFYPIL